MENGEPNQCLFTKLPEVIEEVNIGNTKLCFRFKINELELYSINSSVFTG